MKSLIKTTQILVKEGRWDIDYHLPAEGIRNFPAERVAPVSRLAVASNEARNPTLKPDKVFLYVDIASIDIETGTIVNPQELTGEEAPSRARMVIRAFDILVSTVRPTRGAVAVVPPELDNQICSTGLCVVRCNPDVNPFYLHFVLRLDSTLEQFRKFSTGSSYPAILDEDVEKTLVPMASPDEQNYIAKAIRAALKKREDLLKKARQEMDSAVSTSTGLLRTPPSNVAMPLQDNGFSGVTTEEIKKIQSELFSPNSLPSNEMKPD